MKKYLKGIKYFIANLTHVIIVIRDNEMKVKQRHVFNIL